MKDTKNIKTILVSRFSALGDVTISVHVLQKLAEQNPDIQIVLLTRPFFGSLFKNIAGLKIYPVDLKVKHKGILGIRKLCKEITSSYQIDFYADIHDVLRTKLIYFFLPSHIKKAKIDKGRAEKKQLTKKKNKKLHQLKHSAERYADVFRKLGFTLNLDQPSTTRSFTVTKKISDIVNLPTKKIGIAPFAKHKSKNYPTEKMREVALKLAEKNTVLIFGGGRAEAEIAESWQKESKNIISVIGKFSMPDELALIDNCKAIITMDSANMHLASLTSTQIISIWGATHPFAGFTAFGKTNNIYIQKQLPCRPCSVFGNKECYKNTYECLDIDVEKIVEVVYGL